MGNSTEVIPLKIHFNERSKRTHGQKLTRQLQYQVCMDLAYGHSARYIRDEIEKNYGISVGVQDIYQSYAYNPKWQKIIQFLRSRWQKNIASRPCTQKTWRLKHLEKAFMESIESGDKAAAARLHAQILDDVLGRKNGTVINVKQENKTQVFQGLGEQTETLSFADRIRVINDRLSSQRV